MNRAVSHHFLSANLFFQTILLFFITFTNSFSIQIIFLLILSIFYTVFIFSALFVYYTQFQRSIFIYIAQYVFTVFLLYSFLFSTFFEQNTKKSTAIFFHNVYFLSKKDDGNQSVIFSLLILKIFPQAFSVCLNYFFIPVKRFFPTSS